MTAWRNDAKEQLISAGYRVHDPLTGEKDLWPEHHMDAKHKTKVPPSVAGATLSKDLRQVLDSDIILANLKGARKVSIGSVMELAWGLLEHKYILIVKGKRGAHAHPWIDKSQRFKIYSTIEEALDHLVLLRSDCEVQNEKV
jgi:hypothetical protein